MIIPADNEKDLADIPSTVKKKLNFVPVESVEEVLRLALAVEDVDAFAGLKDQDPVDVFSDSPSAACRCPVVRRRAARPRCTDLGQGERHAKKAARIGPLSSSMNWGSAAKAHFARVFGPDPKTTRTTCPSSADGLRAQGDAQAGGARRGLGRCTRGAFAASARAQRHREGLLAGHQSAALGWR